MKMRKMLPILGLCGWFGLIQACGASDSVKTRNASENLEQKVADGKGQLVTQSQNANTPVSSSSSGPASGSGGSLTPSSDMPSTPASLKDIVTIASEDSRFSTLVTAVKEADLVGTLQGAGPFTVFAPTNDAFAKLGSDAIAGLLKNKEMLKNVLLYHVVAGSAVTSVQASSLTEAKMANSDAVKISVKDGALFVNNAQVIIKDIKASNGIIHVLDTVLMPPAKSKTILEIAKSDGRFQTLTAALQAAQLDSTLQGAGPFTVFAPTDEAFAKLGSAAINGLLADKAKLQYVLLYHVISGKSVSSEVASSLTEATMANGAGVAVSFANGALRINNSLVIIKDIQASNGVIHVLDTVLLPPQDIASVVSTDARFKTLKTALETTNLLGALRSKTHMTVFAPTDAAFEKLGAHVVQALLKSPENLKHILLYHVINGYAASSTLIAHLGTLTMANHQETEVVSAHGVLRINQANIIVKDIRTQNGTIHVIDAVLIP
jgi:transforming growth factor-beta-induced protein